MVTRRLGPAGLASALCALAIPLFAEAQPVSSAPGTPETITPQAIQAKYELRVVDITLPDRATTIARCIVVNTVGMADREAFCRYRKFNRYYRDDDENLGDEINPAIANLTVANVKKWTERHIVEVYRDSATRSQDFADSLLEVLREAWTPEQLITPSTLLRVQSFLRRPLTSEDNTSWRPSIIEAPTKEQVRLIHQVATTADQEGDDTEKAAPPTGGVSKAVPTVNPPEEKSRTLSACSDSLARYVKGLRRPAAVEHPDEWRPQGPWQPPQGCPVELSEVARSHQDLFNSLHNPEGNYAIRGRLQDIALWQQWSLAGLAATFTPILVLLFVLLFRIARTVNPGFEAGRRISGQQEGRQPVAHMPGDEKSPRIGPAPVGARSSLGKEQEGVNGWTRKGENAEQDRCLLDSGLHSNTTRVKDADSLFGQNTHNLIASFENITRIAKNSLRIFEAAGGRSGDRGETTFFEQLERFLKYLCEAKPGVRADELVRTLQKSIPDLDELESVRAYLGELLPGNGMPIGKHAEAAVRSARDQMREARQQLEGARTEIYQLNTQKAELARKMGDLEERLNSLDDGARAFLRYLQLPHGREDIAKEVARWRGVLDHEQDGGVQWLLRLSLITLAEQWRQAIQSLAGSDYENLHVHLRIDGLEQVLHRLLSDLQNLQTIELENRLLNEGFGNKWLHDLFRAEQALDAYFADVEECARLRDVVVRTAVTFREALRQLGVDLLPTRIGGTKRVDAKERTVTSSELTAYPEVKQALEDWSRRAGKIIVDVNAFGYRRRGGDSSEPDVSLLNPAEFRT